MTPGDLHRVLLAEEPTEGQQILYDSGKMGFSDKSFDTDQFMAVCVLTLQKTMRVSMYRPERVIMLVAPTHDKWALEQFDLVAGRFLGTLKRAPGSKAGRIQFVKLIGECFKKILVGSRLLQLPEVPDAWTSYGFSRGDLIPDWMREGLRDESPV